MKKIYLGLIAALLFLPLAVNAQALKGSYFMESSLMRNKLNPALTPQTNYVSIPALGNFGLGMQSNVGVANFLFPKEGTLYTYLNDNVTFDEFNSKLPANPYLNLDVDFDIIDFGFAIGKNSYLTVQAGLDVDCQLQLARELFTFAKLGMTENGGDYVLNNFNIYQNTGMHVSAGYSYDFSDLVPGLKAGIKGKFLMGADHVAMKMGESRISMTADEWSVQTDATAQIASTFLKMDIKEGADGTTEIQPVTDFSKIAPSGYGFAVDLGVEYRLSVGSVVDGLTFSFAALDLGAVAYGKNNVQNLKSAGKASFSGFEGISLDDYDFDAHMKEVTDQFMDLANLKEVASEKGLSVSAQPKLLFGVEMPFVHDMMSAGILYSNRFAYTGTTHELTLSYNLAPTDWFNFGLNYSMLNNAKSIGWLIEFVCPNGVDFFIGSDNTLLEFTPQFLPVDKFSMNARFGLSATFGGKKRK